MENSIEPLISADFITVKAETTVANAIERMATDNKSEAYIEKETGAFYGKVYLSSLVSIKTEDLLSTYVDDKPIFLNSDASLQQAIEVASDFIGEAIPVLDQSDNTLMGVISEGDIFKAYLKLQTQIIDLEHKD
jgi:CIC family chloride channel protein